jgi:hypothetical protein
MDVARRAIDTLDANPTAAPIFQSNGLTADAVKQIANDNPAYVALGAIGPDIFFLLPDFKPGKAGMIWNLAAWIRDLYTWWDDNYLGPWESAMGPVEDNLADLENALTGGLKDELESIASEAINVLKEAVIDLIVRQFDFFGLLSSGVSEGYDEQTFFWSDMLHYRETYRFGAHLWQQAGAIQDPEDRARCQAFALGWMAHLATDVTGHAFVNQKAGGPYRLHWQRHHLIENHMDALVYQHDHGAQQIYQQMANAALHLWIAFNPDGSSRVNLFDAEPNPSYPDGDHSADIVGRHAVWDYDSDLPDKLAEFLAAALKQVFNPALQAPATGPWACCPTIISALDDRVPIGPNGGDNGYANAEDVGGAYWWLYKYVKFTTTDYYKIRRPDPPDVVEIPSFPSPPGTGDSDPGPGASDDDSFWDDVLAFLFSLLAWIIYIGEILLWPLAVIAGIIGGLLTYGIRYALYEAFELPLYNLWLGLHGFLAVTGFVMPMPGEINSGLNTLGVKVSGDWSMIVAALGDVDGGLRTEPILPTNEEQMRGYPRDVLLDPPGLITSLIATLLPTPPPVGGEIPSEFMQPWLWPATDQQGDPTNVEGFPTLPGPYKIGMDATALFGASVGSAGARAKFEASQNEVETIKLAAQLLPHGEHLGDPVDYTAYVIAQLTRDIDPATLANFNLDSDRGYAYLCWDWTRDADRLSQPDAFKGMDDPTTNSPTDASQHTYRSPRAPGYGWDPSDQVSPAGAPTPAPFDPNDPQASVRIRYIDRESR